MNMKKFLVFLWIPLLFGVQGCAPKRYEKPMPAMIVIKTPTMRYADQGFIYRNGKGVKIQIYSLGTPIFSMRIGRRVCVKAGCMDEQAFEKRYLGTLYPPGTLAAIFLKRPIFGGENLQCEGERCRQRIKNDSFDIIYAFDSRSASFKDRKHHILLKIREF